MSGTMVTYVFGKSALLQVHKLLLNYCGDNCEDIFVLVLHICHQFKSLNIIMQFIWKPVIWFACPRWLVVQLVGKEYLIT